MVDNQVNDELETVSIDSVDLDIFALAKRNKRKPTFVRIVQRLVEKPLNLMPQINQEVMQQFLERIWQKQRDFNVSYHNDMHCLDVAQMTYILLQTGADSFTIQLSLKPVEQLAAIIAAACHDYGHDGYNNGWHSKIQSDRFIAYGETGVQEQYHFAESWKVIEEISLVAGLAGDEQALFKKRMQQCIMATDMSRHMGDINELKAICETIPAQNG